MKPLQVPAACFAAATILLQYFHKIANKLNNWKKGLYDMPPEKGKESKKGRNKIKESQKGRKGRAQTACKDSWKLKILFISEKQKFSFFLFPV